MTATQSVAETLHHYEHGECEDGHERLEAQITAEPTSCQAWSWEWREEQKKWTSCSRGPYNPVEVLDIKEPVTQTDKSTACALKGK